ncbi:MAG: hypothetical protein PVJ86_11320, partial [Phycisphaerales bacterium]
APRVIVWDGEKATFEILAEIPYISGYSEPDRSSDEPVPEHAMATEGLRLELSPKIMHDDKHITLDPDFQFSELTGSETRIYKEEYPYEVPQMNVVSSKTHLTIPNGRTVLTVGQRMTREITKTSSMPTLRYLPLLGRFLGRHAKTREQHTILIMVKPTILPPEQAEEAGLGRASRLRSAGMGGYGGFGPGGPPPGLGPSGYGKEPNRPDEPSKQP